MYLVDDYRCMNTLSNLVKMPASYDGVWSIRWQAIISINYDLNIYWDPWASYQIRKIARCACTGNAGNVLPRRRFQRKPIVSDAGMHHGTCVTHVPWCMSGSLTCGDGENVPGIPGACAPAILRIWQEAHGTILNYIEAWTKLSPFCRKFKHIFQKCRFRILNQISLKGVFGSPMHNKS